jgi:YHS domain-containing protein
MTNNSFTTKPPYPSFTSSLFNKIKQEFFVRIEPLTSLYIKSMIKIISIAISLMALQLTGFSQGPDVRTKEFNLEKGMLAIQGYDPISYFRKGKAEKGNKELTVQADGVIYRFASAENKELFKKNYKAYEPQYGGWCAYAMGTKGEKVEIDPETFKIIDGKLYLFYNSYFNNTLKSWNKDETSLKTKADANWNKIFH